MQKKCCKCPGSFEITDEDLVFYDKVSPIINKKKHRIPTPTLCTPCREQRRLAIPNVRNFYSRECNLCQKMMVSAYASDQLFTVYCQECWWGDKWDELTYGVDVDFSRPFIEQMQELQLKVPRLTLMNKAAENSEFCNYAGFNKNCYLAIAGSWYNEDCLYGTCFEHSKNSVDCSFLSYGELCYECIYGTKLYNCVYCVDSSDSSDCLFSFNLRGCRNCILSSNIRNKQYYIRNKQCTKQEFDEIRSMISRYEIFQKYLTEFHKWRKTLLRPANYNINCEDCIGDYLRNCKNVVNGFIGNGVEDAKNVFMVEYSKDFMDCCFAGYDNAQLFYECIAAGIGGQRNQFCFQNWSCNDILYCDTPQSSSDCFGCICIRNKQFCILNKQYSKNEYQELVPRIIDLMKKHGEWGEFFPSSYSPFAYNETFAQDYYPLAKKEALMNNLKWREDTNEILKVDRTIPSSNLPDSIHDIPDDILNWAVICAETGKPYRIVKQELYYYRSQNLPVPRLHYDARNKHRIQLHNLNKIHKKQCDKCNKEMHTVYSTDCSETVFCEECYLKEVY